MLQKRAYCKKPPIPRDLDKTHRWGPCLPVTRPDTDPLNSLSLPHKWLDELLVPMDQSEQNAYAPNWLSFFPSSRPLNIGPPLAWASIQPLPRTAWPQGKIFSDLLSSHVTFHLTSPHWLLPCLLVSIKEKLFLPNYWDTHRSYGQSVLITIISPPTLQ